MGSLEKIWTVIALVPTGRVASYGQVADLAGFPRGARLAAKALANVPSELTLPWHRIIRSNGQIAFPNGSVMAQTQTRALVAEGVQVKNNRISMAHFQWQPDLPTLLVELTF